MLVLSVDSWVILLMVCFKVKCSMTYREKKVTTAQNYQSGTDACGYSLLTTTSTIHNPFKQ